MWQKIYSVRDKSYREVFHVIECPRCGRKLEHGTPYRWKPAIYRHATGRGLPPIGNKSYKYNFETHYFYTPTPMKRGKRPANFSYYNRVQSYYSAMECANNHLYIYFSWSGYKDGFWTDVDPTYYSIEDDNEAPENCVGVQLAEFG